MLKKLLILGVALSLAALTSWAQEENVSTKTETHITTVKTTSTSEVNKVVETTKTNTIPKRLNAALFIINNLDSSLQDQSDIFRSVLSSRLAKTGFSIINQDVVMEALKKNELADQNDVLGAVSQQSTALSLAETMGADYLIVARLIAYELEEVNYNRGQTATEMTVHKLHIGYEVLLGDNGSSFLSGAISPQRADRRTADISIVSNNYLIGLMNEAADQIADELQTKLARLKTANAVPVPTRTLMPFTVNCVLADLSLAPLTMPLFWINNDGTLTVPDQGVKNASIYANGAIVELDGAMIGTTPGTFDAKPGLHKITITRKGTKPITRTINIKRQSLKPQELNISVAATEEEVAKLKESILFYQDLLERNQEREIALHKAKAEIRTIDTDNAVKLRLSEAEAERIKGYAKMLEQSGFRVDARSNYQGKSPYDGGVINWMDINKNTLFDH